jgi:peptidoglycan/xylan/chitin deacetylase (PgdA/CDA1 family)
MQKTKILIILLLSTVKVLSQENPNQWPQIAGDGTLRRLHLPILMYHYVSPLPVNADNVRVGLTLDPVMFRQHVEYLDEAGYNTVSLYEMDEALMNGAELPTNPVILTFDDGYAEHYNYVFPLLREHNMKGTFFVITQFTDNNAENYLAWSQVEEMDAAGMSMEAHTKNHVDLRNRDYDYLVFEIVGSIESLEAHLGNHSRMFAYPVGRYDDTTLAVLASTNVLRAVTTQIGSWQTSDNRLEVPRMRITNETNVSGLIYLLNYGQ